MAIPPRVTVSFIHYSEKEGYSTLHHLEPFLESLHAQTVKDMEIFCIDNASTDTRYKEILQKYPHIRLIELPTNKGTCAHNEALKDAIGEYFWCVTLDTRFEPTYLETILNAADHLPDGGSFGGTLFRMDAASRKPSEEIDSQGIIATKAHQFYEKNAGKHLNPKSLTSTPQPVFAISGATVVYRTSALQAISYEDATCFDEQFFMYKEDIDVGYRLLWYGFKNYTIPNAIGYHVRSVREDIVIGNKTTSSMFNRLNKSTFGAVLSYRNQFYLLQKNFTRHYPRSIVFQTLFYILGRIFFAHVVERRLLAGYKEFQKNRSSLRITPKKIPPQDMKKYFS